MKREMQYERQSIVSAKNWQPGWERISENRLKKILSPLEIRLSLPSGKIIETITCRYRAVALPTFAEFRNTRVIRKTRPYGYDYLRGEYGITLVEKKNEPLRLVPSGPGITPKKIRKWTCELDQVDKLEKRIYRMARKQGILFNVIH